MKIFFKINIRMIEISKETYAKNCVHSIEVLKKAAKMYNG